MSLKTVLWVHKKSLLILSYYGWMTECLLEMSINRISYLENKWTSCQWTLKALAGYLTVRKNVSRTQTLGERLNWMVSETSSNAWDCITLEGGSWSLWTSVVLFIQLKEPLIDWFQSWNVWDITISMSLWQSKVSDLENFSI